MLAGAAIAIGAFCSPLTVLANDEDDSSAYTGFELNSDKEEYAASDSITVNGTFQNQLPVPVSGFRVEAVVPDGYHTDDESGLVSWSEILDPEEVIEISVTYHPGAYSTSVPEGGGQDPADTGLSETDEHNIGQTNRVPEQNQNTEPAGQEASQKAAGEEAGTGVKSYWMLFIFLLMVASLTGFCLLQPKKGKKLFSLLLCLGLSASLVQASSVKAEEEAEVPGSAVYSDDWTDKFEVIRTVTVNGTEKNLSFFVSYTIPAGQDSDEDGLSDAEEIRIGTDPMNPDTDGDGLDDHTEAYIVYSDPLTADADGDADEDGITNIDEVGVWGTDPASSDSDSDGISDIEEIQTTGTDPNNPDSDDDGVIDGFELEIGTNPVEFDDLFPVTAGEYGSTGNYAEVSVNLPADQVHSLYITENRTDSLFNDSIPGWTGSAFDIESDGEFDSALIRFDLNGLPVSEGFDPVICWVNEETGLLEQLPTEIDGNMAVAETTHFSSYILLDRSRVDEAWNTEIMKPGMTGSAEKPLEVMFVIDRSGSMDWNDPNSLAKSLSIDFISKMRDGTDYAGLVTFTRIVQRSRLTMDLDSIKQAIDSYSLDSGWEYGSGTDGSAGLDAGLNLFNENIESIPGSGNDPTPYRDIIFITDGEDNGYSTSYNSIVKKANALGVKIYSIGIGTANERTLQMVADQTGGKYFRATATDEDLTGLDEVFQQIELETVDYITDSNNDGISDYFTKLLCDGTLRVGTGSQSPFYLNSISYDEVQENAYFDGDGLPNGSEIEIRVNEAKDAVYVKMKSDPTLEDSDFDGILDLADTMPFSNSFKGGIHKNNPISNVRYSFDYRSFFPDENKVNGGFSEYNDGLSRTSLIFANQIYGGGEYYFSRPVNFTTGGSDQIFTCSGTTDIRTLMQIHGFQNVQLYDLSASARTASNSGAIPVGYTDDDLSEFAIGYHDVHSHEGSKRVFGLIIRGTNATVEEWSSNFDVGDLDHGDFTDWSDRNHHRGFEVTSNRILKLTRQYVSENSTGESCAFWLTGHSRGAALANIIGSKLIDDGYQVNAYTFATPKTTVDQDKAASPQYQSIFNIVNTNDLVPMLPLTEWGFVRYGQSLDLSISTYGAQEFSSMAGNHYSENKTGNLNYLIKNISNLSNGSGSEKWKNLYKYQCSCHKEPGFTGFSGTSQNYTPEVFEQLPERIRKHGVLTSYQFVQTGKRNAVRHVRHKVCQKPAFLLMSIAEPVAMVSTDLAGGIALLVKYNVAPAYEWTKTDFLLVGLNMADPHTCDGYYVLIDGR